MGIAPIHTKKEETAGLNQWKRFIVNNDEAGFYRAVITGTEEIEGYDTLVLCHWAAIHNRAWFVDVMLRAEDKQPARAPDCVMDAAASTGSLSLMQVFIVHRGFATHEQRMYQALRTAMGKNCFILVMVLLFDMNWKTAKITSDASSSSSPEIQHALWCYEHPELVYEDPWTCPAILVDEAKETHKDGVHLSGSGTPRAIRRPRNARLT